MRYSRLLFLYFLLSISVATGLAQQTQPILSPEVLPDNRITFRLRAPNAKEVMMAREGVQPAPMQKNEQGVWSVTIAPVEPDYYGYSFIVDGVALIDPSNYLMKPNLLFAQSMVHVPGPTALPWEQG